MHKHARGDMYSTCQETVDSGQEFKIDTRAPFSAILHIDKERMVFELRHTFRPPVFEVDVICYPCVDNLVGKYVARANDGNHK